MFQSKQIIILKGLPGAGKSFLAKQILDQATEAGLTCRIHAIDDQFIINGEYKFDIKKFGYAHSENQRLVRESVNEGVDIVIVDNTNLTSGEIRPYAEIAKEFDYIIQFMEPDTEWKDNIEVLKEKNVHGVPQESYDRMLRRYQETDAIGEDLAELLDMEYDSISKSLFNNCPRIPKSKPKIEENNDDC